MRARTVNTVLAILFAALTVAFTVFAAGARGTPSSASETTPIPLGELLYDLDRDSLNLAQAVTQRYISERLWDPHILNILVEPAYWVFAIIAAMCAFFAVITAIPAWRGFRRAVPLLALLIAAPGLGGAGYIADLDRDLGTLAAWLDGHFENGAQVLREAALGIDPDIRHQRVDFIFRRIDLPAFGDVAFYSEQSSDEGGVFRQAIYTLNADPDRRAIVMRAHLIVGDRAAATLGAFDDPAKLAGLTPDMAPALPEGCETLWERRIDQFHGAIAPGCRIVSPRSGNELMLKDELYLSADALWFNDRGTDFEGNYAYGNKAGIPFMMTRVAE